MTNWTPDTDLPILVQGHSDAESGSVKLMISIVVALVFGLIMSIAAYFYTGAAFSFSILAFAALYCVVKALNTPADQNVGRAFALTEKAMMFNNRDDVLVDDISGVAGSGATVILKRKYDKKKPLQITDVPNATEVRDVLKKLKFDQRPDYERT